MIPAVEPFNTYHRAEALLAAGDLRQAADLCKLLLDKNPNFSYGHHLMSSLFYRTGSFDRAQTFSQKAIELEPDVYLFHFEHGRVLCALEDFPAAEESFKKAHALDPENPMPVLLWADACMRQAKMDEAQALFGRARLINNIPEIDEHEGLYFQRKGNLVAAEQLFDQVIKRNPEYFYGHIHKGRLLMERKEDNRAEACFAKALKLNPQAYPALYCLALINERQGHLEIATRYAMQAIQVNPQAWECHGLLGVLLIGQHHYQIAEEVLRQAHTLQPNNAHIIHWLIVALQRQQKSLQALMFVENMLKVRPGNTTMHYFRAMLRGERTETVPGEYIAGFFDGYADRFDHHLPSVLHYQVPALLSQAIFSLPEAAEKKALCLLDLGCGTGLAAQALYERTAERVGVDLSAKMLDKACGKGLYAQLHQADIVEFMEGCGRLFDLVIAADVLIYVGDLAPFFKAARMVLPASGLLAFSIETEISLNAFKLNPTGRYSHSLHYILQVAGEEGYTLVKQEDVVVRVEGIVPVQGMLFIFKKGRMH